MEAYRGNNFWDRLIRDEGEPPRHVHGCPHCYEHVPCNAWCTLCPDLELEDGTPCGGYEPCNACRDPRHEHTCPWCGEDTECSDPTCIQMTWKTELELARGLYRVCPKCTPAVWPVPEEQLLLKWPE